MRSTEISRGRSTTFCVNFYPAPLFGIAKNMRCPELITTNVRLAARRVSGVRASMQAGSGVLYCAI